MPLEVFLLLISAAAVGLADDGGTDCPPWFERVNSSNSGYCVCAADIPHLITCNQKEQSSFLALASCAFYVSERGLLVTECPFVFPEKVIENNVFPLPADVRELNAVVCGNLSREVKGPFCGRCTGNKGPSIYSAGTECVGCSPVNVLYYLLLQYLPTTLLFLAVLVFRLNVTAAPMAHYVLSCNLVVMNYQYFPVYAKLYGTRSAFISNMVKAVLTLSAVWSFDALRFISPPLCISRHMEEIYLPFIEFLTILYPFLLLLLTYAAIELHARNFKPVVALWRLLSRMFVQFYRSWDPSSSMIQAFSSLFFLSYAKFIVIIWEPFITVTDASDNTTIVYTDPNVPLLSAKHVIMITFSMLVLLFLYLPPIVLLVLYPTPLYRKISQKIKPQWKIRIKIYVETFHGCFKDGTNGTRDYRALSGCFLALLGVIVQLVFYTVTVAFRGLYNPYKNVIALNAAVVFFVITALLCTLAQPYKQRIANVSAATILALLSTFLALYATLDEPQGADATRVMMVILLLVPHCAFGCYMVWKIRKLTAGCGTICNVNGDERELLYSRSFVGE